MKTSNTHALHRWAHNDNPDAEGRSGNIRYRGQMIWYYSTIMAVKYPEKKTFVLAGRGITCSSRTTGWKSAIRGAMNYDGWKCVEVDCINFYGNDLRSLDGIRECHNKMATELGRFWSAFLLAKSGISKQRRYEEYLYEVGRCNEVAGFLGRKPVKALAPDKATAEKMAAAQAKAEANAANWRSRQAARWARQAEIVKKSEAERADMWRRREPGVNFYGGFGTYLRLSKCGRHVETSRGVVVPIEDAVRLFRLCSKARSSGVSIEELRDSAVGPYGVERVEANGDCKVGCHTLTWDEMSLCHEAAKARGLVK